MSGGAEERESNFHRYIKIDKTDTNNGQIGDGAYGVVYRALDVEENVKVALKRIKLENEDGMCVFAILI